MECVHMTRCVAVGLAEHGVPPASAVRVNDLYFHAVGDRLLDCSFDRCPQAFP